MFNNEKKNVHIFSQKHIVFLSLFSGIKENVHGCLKNILPVLLNSKEVFILNSLFFIVYKPINYI